MKNYNDLNISKKIKVKEFEFYRIEKFKELKTRLNWTYKRIGIPSIILGAIFFVYTIKTSSFEKGLLPFLAISVIPSVIYFIYYRYNFDVEFESKYKNEILKKLIPLIDENIHYCPNKVMTFDEIYESNLFNMNYVLMMDDYFEGKLKDYSFIATDLKVNGYKLNVGDTSTRKELLVFFGMFFIIDFGVSKDLKIDVISNKNGELEGTLSDSIHKLLVTKKGKIQFENGSFNHVFAVYSDNESLCKELFTKNFQTFLIDLLSDDIPSFSFSLRNGKLYCALNRNLDSFKIELSKGISVEKMMVKHFKEFKLFFDTIDSLITEVEKKMEVYTVNAVI